MMKKFLISLCLICSIFLFSACRTQKRQFMSMFHFHIEFEPEYNLDEEIYVKISFGIDKEHQESLSRQEDIECILCYSTIDVDPDETFPTDDCIILYTITDFTNDIYYCTYQDGKIHYGITEIFTIKKEIFTEDNGEFYIIMGNVGFEILTQIIYEKKEGSLFLQQSNKPC